MAAATLRQADVEELETKLNTHPEDSAIQRKLLACLRALKTRRPDLVARAGLPLLAGGGRGLGKSEVWDVREQVYLACLELHMWDHAEGQLDQLQAKFPKSVRVKGLQGMMSEAKGGASGVSKADATKHYEAALGVYKEVLEEDPANAFALKRKVCCMRGLGSPEALATAVGYLNEYLELYPTDVESWRELSEAYLEQGHVEAAKFALEECLMLSPVNYINHTMLADTLYTLGDHATARKYYAQSLELNNTPTNARAALGMVLCTTAINGKRGATQEEKTNNGALFEVGKTALVESYEHLPPNNAGKEVVKLARRWLKMA
uniref:ER membrane protein complex subunit 2 n=1 Tax=Hemiselmis tepida TaxID=464990 RepID=A0A7S0W6L3_9CRYP